jgi:Fur family ferric uptake transcriptional regulator
MKVRPILKYEAHRGKAPSKRTRERELILDRLHSLPGHFSAEDLWLSLAHQGSRVSRATVYRTLDLLVDRGVLQRVHLDEQGARYELIQGREQHAHLYCLGCGKLEDFPMAALQKLPARVRVEKGFEPAHLLLRVCGTCARCQRRDARGISSQHKKHPKGGKHHG